MSKLLALLKSKKFWALVTAIVAALSAFFTTSCAAQAKVHREGVHIDTVRVDYIIRSKSFQTIAQCQAKSSTSFQSLSIPKFFPSTLAFGSSIACVCPMRFPAESFAGLSLPPNGPFLGYRQFSSPSSSMRSTISIMSIPSYSEDDLSLSNPRCRTFGEKCLIAFVPIAFLKRSRRRGGRKGRPKGTKTIPLGGSHL